MSFFSHLGLSLLCVTLFVSLPVHGDYPIFVDRDGPYPNCCRTSSSAIIAEPLIACAQQRRNVLKSCTVNAYIVTTASSQSYCVSQAARWLPRKLREDGIICKIL